jgi:hypothetical protein
MDGRKFDLIREQLGLSNGELARQHGISSSKSLQMHLGGSAAMLQKKHRAVVPHLFTGQALRDWTRHSETGKCLP